MPVGLDPNFDKKVSTIRSLAAHYNVNVRVPTKGDKSKEFDFIELVNQFRQATAIVVDLSYERPSCYYELGLAEALGKSVQLIARSGTVLHQTSHKSDVLYYNNLTEYENILEKQMRRANRLSLETEQ